MATGVQLSTRLLAAAIYEEQAYVDIYSSDDSDLYSHTVTSIYKRKITKVDKEERAIGILGSC